MGKAPPKQIPNAKKSDDPSTFLASAPKLGNRVLNVLSDATDLRDRIYGV